MRHRAKLDGDFRSLLGQPFARAQVERDVLPAPIVEVQPQCCERLGLRVGRHAGFLAVAGYPCAGDVAGAILSAHGALRDRVGMNRTDRMEHVHFLVADLVGVEGDHRLHRDEAEQLHQMILHHVAERACLVVVFAAMLDAHGFGDGDSHIVHIASVPDRLKEGIGEAKGQNVLHRFLAEIVVDAKNLGLVKAGGENSVQGAG